MIVGLKITIGILHFPDQVEKRNVISKCAEPHVVLLHTARPLAYKRPDSQLHNVACCNTVTLSRPFYLCRGLLDSGHSFHRVPVLSVSAFRKQAVSHMLMSLVSNCQTHGHKENTCNRTWTDLVPQWPQYICHLNMLCQISILSIPRLCSMSPHSISILSISYYHKKWQQMKSF